MCIPFHTHESGYNQKEKRINWAPGAHTCNPSSWEAAIGRVMAPGQQKLATEKELGIMAHTCHPSCGRQIK
jgi:hypothetical protein